MNTCPPSKDPQKHTHKHSRNILLVCEWFVLFILGPALVWINIVSFPKLLLFGAPVLYAVVMYLRTKPHHTHISPIVSEKKELIYILLRFIFAIILLTAIILHRDPAAFLAFPKTKPRIWLIVMCGYPLLSALPQEFLYRRFYFARYARLFPSELFMFLSNIFVFSYLHIIYDNIYSVLLTMIGGWLFTRTYSRTASLRLATFEHAIYGLAMFTLGYGRLFYEAP